MWALFLSELLRFVCEAPVALPTKIIGGAMLAFCFSAPLPAAKLPSNSPPLSLAASPRAEPYELQTSRR